MAEEQVQQPGPEVQGKKKKGFLKIIIIVVAALAVAGGAVYYFYGKTLMGQGAKKPSHTVEKKEVGPTVELEPFIINVMGNTSRYVKISVAIEVASEKMVEHTKKLTPILRDSMLTVLGSKAPEAFLDVNSRNTMKKELQDAAGRLYKKGELKAVYITDIIMQ